MKDVTVRDVMDWLDVVAPFESAEDFDNVGLMAGDPSATVRRVLFTLDGTVQAVREALATNAELIVTHHPLIFHPLRSIDYTVPQGQAILALAKSDISLLSAHTNWDKAQGGVSDALAQALALTQVRRGDDYLRLGELPAPLSREALTLLIRERLHTEPKVYGDGTVFSTVAAAGGAYGEAASLAASLGAQAYVVGEIRHHELLDACARGITVFEAGHFATEAPGIAALYQRFLKDAAAASWRITARLFTSAPYLGALCQ